MNTGHYYEAGGYINHGDASALFPVNELSATAHQYRDAHLALNRVNSDDVAVVRPTSFASSYFLTQHPLTTIKVSSLNNDLIRPLSEVAELDL